MSKIFLKISIWSALLGIGLLIAEFWPNIITYIRTEELVEPHFTWKFAAGCLLFFFALYSGKFGGSKGLNDRDTSGMAEVSEGDDGDDD